MAETLVFGFWGYGVLGRVLGFGFVSFFCIFVSVEGVFTLFLISWRSRPLWPRLLFWVLGLWGLGQSVRFWFCVPFLYFCEC